MENYHRYHCGVDYCRRIAIYAICYKLGISYPTLLTGLSYGMQSVYAISGASCHAASTSLLDTPCLPVLSVEDAPEL
jgi:hypothetical protein